MKNSGIEWIGDIPDDWDVQRLKDIFYIIGGCGFKDSFQGNKYGDYPFCKASDINGAYAYLDSAKNYVNNDLVDSQHYKLIPESSILIAKIGEAMKKNHRKINLVKCIVDNNCQALCRKGDDNIKYLFYLLSQIDMAWFDNGGTIPNINNTKLLNFYVPFISVLSQKNIVTLLDKKCAAVDRLIENQSKQIEKLKEYKQSVITDAVTKGLNPSVPMKDSGAKWVGEIPYAWSMTRVGMLFNIILGKMLCNNKPAENYTLGKYFCAANIHFDGVSYGETLKEMWFSPEEQQIYRVHNNDLLIVEGGAGAGGCTIIDEIEESIYVQNSVMIVRPVSLSDIRYLKYWIESLVKRGYISVVCNKATIPHFTKDKLANTPLAAPPIEEQRQIADYLDKKCEKIDKLIALKQQKIEKLNEYKKSLIYEYVTGKKEVN